MDENKFTLWVHAPRKEDAIEIYMEAFGAVRKNDDQNGTVVLEICGRRYFVKEAGNDTRRCSPVLVCENPEILIAKACPLGARIQDEIAEARMVTLGDQFGNVWYIIKKVGEIRVFWSWVWRAFTVINILCAGVGVLALFFILWVIRDNSNVMLAVKLYVGNALSDWLKKHFRGDKKD